ncbi:hypothetical protein [Sphingomonas lacusdianchii]|uniref:hypothetical protein n=1 Tax=Sphingomonas lacusdianchii TaxID=2917992 RepID=UPI001F59B51B|nr:hypothetical protein [Sphingomonas sp. JXJ CY 53]
MPSVIIASADRLSGRGATAIQSARLVSWIGRVSIFSKRPYLEVRRMIEAFEMLDEEGVLGLGP